VVPSSALGLAVLLCLIPGLLYVRLIEATRHPREHSALLEAVEVLAVGLLSIALVVGPWTLIDPEGVRDVVREPAADLRQLVLLAAVLVGGSTAAAYTLARVQLAKSSRRYTPTVWTKTFDEYRPGFVRVAMVELTDGRAFQGTLLAFTLDPAVEQQVSISAPIRRVDTPEAEILLQERMAFSGSQVSSISMQYAPDELPPEDFNARAPANRLIRTLRAAKVATLTEWRAEACEEEVDTVVTPTSR
jgi:hypothetical protein